ncbi:MAG: acetolactate decarboxylase [Lentisphaerota bacterium]
MLQKILSVSCALALLWLPSGCQTRSSNGITQVATIDALLSGVYDGHVSLETLRTHGDFGIGTFEGLDGEMILFDGAFYKVRADGKVYRPPLSERTPFACVTTFVPDGKETIKNPLDMKALEARIDGLAPEQNHFCAFLVSGDFSSMRTRSVPSQKKPYPPLVEVTKTQPVFNLTHVHGTLMGFRSPAFVKGVNVPGYHLHFIADNLSGGGHVLDFEMAKGILEVDTQHEFLNIYLPTGSASFGSADLTQDRSMDLQSVEQHAQPGATNASESGKSK